MWSDDAFGASSILIFFGNLRKIGASSEENETSADGSQMPDPRENGFGGWINAGDAGEKTTHRWSLIVQNFFQ